MIIVGFVRKLLFAVIMYIFCVLGDVVNEDSVNREEETPQRLLFYSSVNVFVIIIRILCSESGYVVRCFVCLYSLDKIVL